MALDDVVMRIVEQQTPTDNSSVDYLPFGVKILKLHVQRNQDHRPALGPIWVRPKAFRPPDVNAADPLRWRVYGTADDDEELWVAWGAGDEKGFCVKMGEKFGINKVALPLDDDGEYYVYLHLIHRPAETREHVPHDKTLTVQAVGDDGEVFGELVVTLTAPKESAGALRAAWAWGEEESVITLDGGGVPHGGLQVAQYVSRWWPRREVTYVAASAAEKEVLEALKVVYKRQLNGQDRGRMDVLLEETVLAEVSGDLALPLHDCRLVSVELFRFTDDFHVVLRLWFYWVHLRFSEAELLAFVPDGQRARWQAEAQRVQQRLAAGLLPYHKNDEVPDLERLDLVINPVKKSLSYVGSDTHWQEFWAHLAKPPLDARLATWKEIINVVQQGKQVPKIEEPVTDPLANGLCDIVNQGSGHGCPHREDKGAVVRIEDQVAGVNYEICAQCGTHFTGPTVRAVGVIGKHAPVLKNAKVIVNAVSNNVLTG